MHFCAACATRAGLFACSKPAKHKCLVFCFPEVCPGNLLAKWRRGGREQKPTCSGSTERRTGSCQAGLTQRRCWPREEWQPKPQLKQVRGMSELAPLPLRCRMVQTRGKGATNQQRKCLESPGELLAVSTGDCERKTNPVTKK